MAAAAVADIECDVLDEVPEDEAARKAWLRERMLKRFGRMADDARPCLERHYGKDRAAAIRTAETIQISEYGSPLKEEDVPRLFPFLPAAENAS